MFGSRKSVAAPARKARPVRVARAMHRWPGMSRQRPTRVKSSTFVAGALALAACEVSSGRPVPREGRATQLPRLARDGSTLTPLRRNYGI